MVRALGIKRSVQQTLEAKHYGSKLSF